jgi:hypothetical protein
MADARIRDNPIETGHEDKCPTRADRVNAQLSTRRFTRRLARYPIITVGTMSIRNDKATTTGRTDPWERSDARFVNIDDAARFLGISRGHAYKQAHRFLETGKDLPCIKVGERFRVPRTWLDQVAAPHATDSA